MDWLINAAGVGFVKGITFAVIGGLIYLGISIFKKK